MRSAKKWRAQGSHEDRSLLGHPSACVPFAGCLQVTWHHTGAVVAIILHLSSVCGQNDYLAHSSTSLWRGVKGCHMQLFPVNCQLAGEAAYHLLGKREKKKKCLSVLQDHQGKQGAPESICLLVTGAFTFWGFVWGSEAHLALNVRAVQRYPDLAKNLGT